MTTTLCIKYNNAGVKEICPLCRREFRADVGFVLWVDGTGDLVCDECAGKEAPELLAAARQLGEIPYQTREQAEEQQELVAAAYGIADCFPAEKLAAFFAALAKFQTPAPVDKWAAVDAIKAGNGQRGEAACVKPQKRFYVYSSGVEYHDHKNVGFAWFKEDAETAWDELFTEDEAKQLAAYLITFPGEITIKGVTQLPDDAMGYGALPVGGETDFHMLSKKPGYPLPFSVWGYFDLRSAEGPLSVLRPERDKGVPGSRAPITDLDSDIPF